MRTMRRIAHPSSTLLAGSLSLLGLLAFACATARPKPVPIERGMASWYGPGFHGRPTASGERYDMNAMTAAHQTLPFGTVVEVRNVSNGLVTRVKINDRGPFKGRRVLDLSRAAAAQLDMLGPGTALVEIVAVGLEPIGGFTFTVQLGAFHDPALAETVAARARARHPEVEVRTDAVWSRVQIGSFARRDEAQRFAAELQEEGFDAVVVPLAEIDSPRYEGEATAGSG
jgi:rare lipoprotein A